MIVPTVVLPSRLAASRLLGMACEVSGGPVSSPDANQRGYALGNPGRPAQVPTLLIMVFDDSASVTGWGGNDPLSNRYAEAAHAFSVVARRGSRRELGAVLHFDIPSSAEAGPVRLTRWGMRLLHAGLRMPRGAYGSSELAPSLQRATRIAQDRPNHKTTLVVLSDFCLLDRESDEVLARLVVFPGDVHAVVLGNGMVPGMPDENVTVTTIGSGDPPGAVARAVFGSLMTHRQRMEAE